MTEAQLHRQVAGFLNACLLAPAVWTSFPAGGGGAMRGRILKAAGLRAGWPDIQIFWRDQMNLHLSVGMIELKTPKKGRVSDAQTDCHAALRDLDCRVAVCRSLEDVKSALDTWRIPLRSVSLSAERMTAAIERLKAREAAAGEAA
jgi:hypothetical protein